MARPGPRQGVSVGGRLGLAVLLLATVWSPFSQSTALECAGGRGGIGTALLLQKKGPEAVLVEVNVTTGRSTGLLRASLALQGSSFSGVVLDDAQRLHVIPAVPPLNVSTLDLAALGQGFASSVALRHADPLLGPVTNVWNVAPRDGSGLLWAASPAPNYRTSVLSVDPSTGSVEVLTSVLGVPVRGLFAADRAGGRYFTVVLRSSRPALVTYVGGAAEVAEGASDLGFDELVGMHFDEVACRLLGLFLRAPGLLSVRGISVGAGGALEVSAETEALSPAASLAAQAYELVGLTAFVPGAGGGHVVSRDPYGAVSAFDLGADSHVTMEVDGDVVALVPRRQALPEIASAAPDLVGMAGGSTVTIVGADFGLRDPSPSVTVGHTRASMVTWTSDTIITALAPPVSLQLPNSVLGDVPQEVLVEFGGRAVDFVYDVFYVPSWRAVAPSEGSVVGGLQLVVSGGRFEDLGQYLCEFGGVNTTLATRVDDTTLRCLTPFSPVPAALVPLDILYRGEPLKKDGPGEFRFTAGAAVRLAVLPSRPASLSGGVEGTFDAAVQDVAGNTVQSFTGYMELRIVSGASLLAAVVQQAAAGVCSFPVTLDAAGTYTLSFKTLTGPVFTDSFPIPVLTGPFSTFVFDFGPSNSVLAGIPAAPAATVSAVDAGGNVVAVNWTANLSLVNSTSQFQSQFQATPQALVNGVAAFPDLTLYAAGDATVEVQAGGFSAQATVRVLYSAPVSVYSNNNKPASVHKSMEPFRPAPCISVLDVAGNIIVEQFWTQDPNGTLVPHYLNLTISASLLTAFDSASGQTQNSPAEPLVPPFLLPSGVEDWEYHLYGVTQILLQSDPALTGGGVCPGACSGNGACSAGACSCASGWAGPACLQPAGALLCGAERCPSGLGYFFGGVCDCQAAADTTFSSSQFASNATFDQLLINTQAQGYVLVFSSPGLAPARSFAFSVVPGAASHLWLLSQPRGGYGGDGLVNPPLVEVRDGGGNLVRAEPPAAGAVPAPRVITVELGEGGPPGAALVGATAYAVVLGHALVDQTAVDLVGANYTLRFASAGLVPVASDNFTVVPGRPHALAVLAQPGGARGGEPLAAQPVVEVRDRGTNRVNGTLPVAVTAALAAPANLSAATISSGGSVVVSAQGLANFTDLAVDLEGAGYVLSFSSPGLLGALSAPFDVVQGAAYALVVVAQPGNATGGVIRRQPSVEVYDAGGNLVTAAPQLITVTASRPGLNGSVHAGSGNSSGGVVNFTDLAVGPAGANYTLAFRSAAWPDAPPALSALFDVLVGEPFSFDIVQQPADWPAGLVLPVQQSVVLRDRGGNAITQVYAVQAVLGVPAPLNRTLDEAFATTLPESNYTGAACRVAPDAPALGGTTAVLSDASGFAKFTDLSVNAPAPNYTLSFVANGVVGATSEPFTIVLGPGPERLRALCAPLGEVANVRFAQPVVVEVVDRGGNRRHVPGGAPPVNVTLVTPLNRTARLSGGRYAASFGDLAAFTDLAIDTAGAGYVLMFQAAGLDAGFSDPFEILPSGAAALSIGPSLADAATLAPQAFAEGGVPFAASAAITDVGGNLVVNDTRNVTVELWENVREARAFECQGAGACTAAVNATVPAGARLVSARLTVRIRCTDLDNAAERVTVVRVGLVELAPSEFSAGPWAGCARNCSDSREVLNAYEIVRDVCWSADGSACARLVLAQAWDPEAQTSWEFYQQVAAADTSQFPVTLAVSPDVNFHPCDGAFLSAAVALDIEYALPPPGAGTLGGAARVAAGGGVASFTDLTVDVSGARYTLRGQAEGMQDAFSRPFSVIPGPVARVGVAAQPGNGTGNSTLSPQPRAELQDPAGNRVPDEDDYVNASLVLASGAPASAGALRGRTSVLAAGGLAEFTDLFVGPVGSYRLNFSSQGAEPALTDVFNVSAGPVYSVGAATQPGDGFGGEPLSVQPVAAPQDWSGNPLPEPFGGNVTVSIGVNGGVIGTLFGNLTQPLGADGLAYFTDLYVDRVGQLYTLSFALAGLAPGESDGFDVLLGNQSKLVVVRQPTQSTVDQLLTRMPAVAVTDAGGNVIEGWVGAMNVSIAVQGAPFHPSLPAGPNATLVGPRTGYLYLGTTYFYGLRLDGTGVGFVLEFTPLDDATLAPVRSAPFDVFGGPAVALAVLAQPALGKATVPAPEILVAAVDGNGAVDALYEGLASVAVAAAAPAARRLLAAGPTLAATQGVAPVLGVFSFTDVTLSGASAGLVLAFASPPLNGTATAPFEVMDAWTGWYELDTPYPAAQEAAALRRDAAGQVVGEFSGATSVFSYVAEGPPEAEAASGCQVSVGVVYNATGGGAGSFRLRNCGGDAVGVLSADRALPAPATTWAKDVEYFEVEETFPAVATRRYVVVANSFNGTSYTTDSALYEWAGGDLVPVAPTPFPGTKGAHSWHAFVMGGQQFLIVANHYDDMGTGFGVPSIIYRYAWSSALGANAFSAVQSISTPGAAQWESFTEGEDTYLAVANYFNGSSFDINSKLFKLARTTPDSPLPRIVSVQSIPTQGARSVAHVLFAGTHYVAFANRKGGTVRVYRFDAAAELLVLFTTISSQAALSVEAFTLGDAAFLAITNLGGANSSNSSVYTYDGAAGGGFALLQTLPTPGASYAKHFVSCGEDFLAVANVHNYTATDGTSEVYRWDGARFAPHFVLPTRNAYALAAFTVPCETTASDGLPCGARATEDVIVAANGWGFTSVVFHVYNRSLALEGTHLAAGPPPADALAGSVLAPGTTATLYKLGEVSASKYPRTATIAAELFAEAAPLPAALPREVPVSGAASLTLPPLSESVTYGGLSVAAAGNLSLRVGAPALSNVSFSMTGRFALAPDAAVALRVDALPPLVNSAEPFEALVSARDAYGNFQPAAAPATVSATLLTGGYAPIAGAALSGVTAPLAGGVANFSALAVDGSYSGVRLDFTATGLTNASSAPFDVAAPTFLQALGAGLPVLAGGTATGDPDSGLLYSFGGLDAGGSPTDLLYAIDTSSQPFAAEPASTTRRRRTLLVTVGAAAPSPRYDHAAVFVRVFGVPSLLVLGGRDLAATFSDARVLDLGTLQWSDTGAAPAPARSAHGAIACVPTTDGGPTVDGSTTVVVFGGRDAAGAALGALSTLRVLNTGVTDSGAPAVASGAPPAPRWDFMFAWVSGSGYILGGRGPAGDLGDDSLYSFTLDYQTGALAYAVAWGAAVVPTAVGGLLPATPIVRQPVVVGGSIYVFAPAPANASDAAVFLLEPAAGRWQPVVDSRAFPGGVGAFPAQMVQVAHSKIAVFFPRLGGGDSAVVVLSLVPSVRLSATVGVPASARAGQALSPQPVVSVLDSAGAIVTGSGGDAQVSVSAYDAATNASIPLGGTTSVAAVAGVAAFVTLSVNLNTSGVVLRFTSPALLPASTAPFPVAPGPVARVEYVQEPQGALPGALFVLQPSLRLVDVAGNLVASDSFSTLAAALEEDAGGGAWAASAHLTGTASVGVVAGYGQYSDLGIAGGAPAGLTFRLVVSRGGAVSAVSAPFNFTGPEGTELILAPFIPATPVCAGGPAVDPAACLAFGNSPNVFAGPPLATQPKLTFELLGTGLPLPAFGGVAVSATLIDALTGLPVLAGANPTPLLTGATTAAAAGGGANFTDLGVNRAGGPFLLRFASPGMEPRDSAAFAVLRGPPEALAVLVDVAGPEAAGVPLAQQPQITVLDAGVNPASAPTRVTAALLPAGGAALGGTTVVETVAGTAAFTDLSVGAPGTAYALFFSVADGCCGGNATAWRNATSASFDVSIGDAYALAEEVAPGGALGGVAFAQQPVVRILDAGGNLVTGDSSTVVTASIGLDNSLYYSLLSTPPTDVGVTILDLEPFEVDGVAYVMAARSFDGSTYLVNSTLYSFDNATETLVFVQSVPSLGAYKWTSFVASSGATFLVNANNFREVAVIGGAIAGTYATQSFLFRFEPDLGLLQFAGAFDTFGATSVAHFAIGANDFIAVANSNDDADFDPPSEIFRVVDRSSNVTGIDVQIASFQTLSTSAAQDVAFFQVGLSRYLAVANRFAGASYTANSTVFKLVGGRFEPWRSVETYGAVSVDVFAFAGRTFLVFCSSLSPSLDAADGGLVDVYEVVGDALALRQRVGGVDGVEDADVFRLNQASWIALATSPLPSQAGQAGAVLLVWNNSNCSDPATCEANFTRFNSVAAADTRAVAFFRGEGTTSYLAFAGAAGIQAAAFRSLAGFTGNTRATASAGRATFTDLGINLAQAAYVITYEAVGLLPADGAPFPVLVGPATALALAVQPAGAAGGEALAAQPVVHVVDVGGNVLESDSTTLVSASLLSGGGSLGGLRVAPAVNGVATFTDLSIATAGPAVLRFSSVPATGAADASITVVVGAPRALSVAVQPGGAAGAQPLAPQPSVTVLDGGGNTVVGAEASVEATIDLPVAAAPALLTSEADAGVVGVAGFQAGGETYSVGWRAPPAVDVSVRRWACGGLVLVQTLATGEVGGVDVWARGGAVWLAAARPAGLLLFAFDEANRTFATVDTVAPVDGATVAAAVIGGAEAYLLLGLRTAAPYSHAVNGLAVRSFNGTALALEQELDLGAPLTALAHVRFEGDSGPRDLLVAVVDDGGGGSEFRFFLFSGAARAFGLWGADAPAETWPGDATNTYPTFQALAGAFILPFEVLALDAAAYAAPGGFVLAVATGDAGTSGAYVFAAAGADQGVFHQLGANGAAPTSAVFFRGVAEGKLYAAFGSAAGVEIYEYAASVFSSVGVLVSAAGALALDYVRFALGGSALLAATGAGVDVVEAFGGAGVLAGTTAANASSGTAAFTDLRVGPAGSYRLSFALASARGAFPSLRLFEEAAAVGSDPLAVAAGAVAALRYPSPSDGIALPAAVAVDAGGNDVAADTGRAVLSVRYNPVEHDDLKERATFATTGARRVTHVVLGTGEEFVAVANQYDGASYDIDSALYAWDSGTQALSLAQLIPTSGAYEFTHFSLPAGGVGPAVEEYLAVANHYGDSPMYSAQSKVYRWDGAAFGEVAARQTYGATHWEAFSIGSERFLAVANYFDGTFHAVNSYVFKYTYNGTAWELGAEPYQELPTVGCHHLAFFAHGGKSYLAAAQQWDQEFTTYALYSVVYAWDADAGLFAPLGTIPSQAALQIEPFVLGGALHLAVANSLDAVSGLHPTDSYVYKLTCVAGADVFELVQRIPTEGATRWRHFLRGGLHHLAVTNWVPDDTTSRTVLYIHNGTAFDEYVSHGNPGAFDVAVWGDSTGYYMAESLPADPQSVLSQLLSLNSTLDEVPPVLETQNTAAGIANFGSAFAPVTPTTSKYWDTWVIDFFADDVEPTASGPYP